MLQVVRKKRAYLNIDLVTAKNNGDVLTDTDEITMPVGDVLVGDSRGDIEHDNSTLATDTARNMCVSNIVLYVIAISPQTY